MSIALKEETSLLIFTEEEAKKKAELLKAFADPTRLQILALLLLHDGTLCHSEIVARFTLEQPTISHHLRILHSAGLTDSRKHSHWSYHYIVPSRVAWVRAYLFEGLV